MSEATEPMTVRELIDWHILRTLANNKGDKVLTAKQLGVSLKTIYNRVNALRQEARES